MLDYQEYLDGIDPEAYHKGEWQWEEDGYTVTRTNQYSAPGCHDSCGVLFYVKDGKLEKVEGDPYQPYSGGKLCMRCLDLVEAVNHPDRLRYPMKREPEDRGDNSKWERITWEEAYDMIEEHVRNAWATDGPESIMVLNGTGRNVTWQIPISSHLAFKTPNQHGVLSGHACYMPRLCGSAAILGDYLIADASLTHPDRYVNKEWKNPEVIVVWANEPLVSNADGYLGHWLAVCHQLGSKIISVDPRLTWWGARADYFLQLRAGTDTALACAWLNVITTEDLIDHDFVDCWCTGYEELCDSVKDMTPEWAAEICGLDPEEIRGSARLYASGNNSTIQWGLAGDQQWSCMSLNLAHCDLMAICGNVDVPGGNIFIHNSFEINAGYASFEKDVPEDAESRKLSTLFGLGIDAHDLCASAHPDANLLALESGKTVRDEDYPINMVWFQGSNNLACTAQDAPRWYEAWKKSPFNVVLDCFMTPTAVAAADLVLPIAMSCERNSARTWWVPARTMIKVTDFYEAKSDEQIGIDLARRLNPEVIEGKYGIYDEFDLLNWYLHGADGISQSSSLDSGTYTEMEEGTFTKSWQELNEDGGWAYDEWNEVYKKYEKGMLRTDGKPGFNTPTGRAELTPMLYEYWGFPKTPVFVENPESPVSTPDLAKEYPLVWSSGGRSYEFFHSEHRQLETMREFHPLPLFQINPEDAERFGIRDGEWAWIENPHGRFRQVAEVTVRVKPGFVHAEHGWWFPEGDASEPSLFGTFDSNPNCCTRAMNYGAGGLGSPIKGMICKVYPYTEGDTLPGEQVTRRGGFGDYIPGVLAPDRAKAEKILAAKQNVEA